MYQEFSYYYDTLAFDIPYEEYAKRLGEKMCENPRILEFGCGTGRLTQQMVPYAQEILGLDLSEDMLQMAKKRLAQEIQKGKVRLVEGDMTNFRTEGMDAVVCLLDTTNYLLDPQEISFYFQNANASLKEGGDFLFDINSEYKLREVLGDNTFVYEHAGIFYTWDSIQDEPYVDFHLNFFIPKDGLYERVQEDQTERIYTVEELSLLLRLTGFEIVEICDLDTGGPLEDQTQRILFHCKKRD